MITLDSRVVAVPDQLASELAGEVVILNLASGNYYGLDAVGATIWNLIQTPGTVRDLCNALAAEYQIEPEICTADVLELLTELVNEQLVELQHA
jgi:hypothetical protein